MSDGTEVKNRQDFARPIYISPTEQKPVLVGLGHLSLNVVFVLDPVK
jgi:hypothetical protein